MSDIYHQIKQQDFKGKLTSGNLFDRYHGLEQIFPHCKGATIFDIGCYNGMVSYKCAEAGAMHIDGIDVYQHGLDFATELFEDIPVPARFLQCDLSEGREHFLEFAAANLKPEYDIVLYLAVYQHLCRQMDKEEVDALTKEFMARAKRWFAFRTPRNSDVIALCEAEGLKHHWTSPEQPNLAQLVIYEKPA